jgi:DNA-binding transcriptional LysR family regulator
MFCMNRMRHTHVHEADLNLLEPLHALLEERQITRAAIRCELSQPAMSRVLERLRKTFDDELLIRAGSVYERSPRGEQLLAELQDILPRLEAVIRGNRFDPATSRVHFQIATTDYAGATLLPKLYERIAQTAPLARLDVIAWDDAAFENVQAGRVDLAIIGLRDQFDLEYERLFTDEFVCLVSQKHPLRSQRLTLKTYLKYAHVTLAIKNGRQPWIDDMLAERGLERRVAFATPFHLAATFATSRSDLICTMSRRIAEQLAPFASVCLLEAPKGLPRVDYGMAWHRRLRDDAAQVWLRDQIRGVSATM